MKSGWHDEIYYNLFDAKEIESYNRKYLIPGKPDDCRIIGLYFWDDFIVRKGSQLLIVPTVPFDVEYEGEIELNPESIILVPDAEIADTIKWYTKPVVFGGDPDDAENVQWVGIEDHVNLVNFWNKKYSEM